MKLVAIMLESFPRTNIADGDQYMRGLADSLLTHPRSIAVACAHPVNGLLREIMFKPTIADVHRWCDRESQWLLSMRDRFERAAAAPIPVSPTEDRNKQAIDKSDKQITREREMRASLDELKAKHGPTWGIGLKPDKVDTLRIGHNVDLETDAEKAEQAKRTAAAARADRQIIDAYAKLGIEPKHFGGILVSPYLLRTMGHDVAPPSTTNKNDDAEEA